MALGEVEGVKRTGREEFAQGSGSCAVRQWHYVRKFFGHAATPTPPKRRVATQVAVVRKCGCFRYNSVATGECMRHEVVNRFFLFTVGAPSI